jgi:hypothetical protein
LREWIEFHRVVGAERFFLYNNLSVDDHAEELAAYVDAGIVVLIDWPEEPGQYGAYSHCLREHRGDSRWIAFLDLDEFLFSPTTQPLPEILVEFEEFPAVGVNLALFGTSGHVTPPPGLVIENYVWRAAAPKPGTHIKSIVDPTRAGRPLSGHHFVYESGVAVDERRRPIEDGMTASPSMSVLRVNHYVTKSRAEWMRKLGRRRPDLGVMRRLPRLDVLRQRDTVLNAELDHTITAFVPQVRERLQAPVTKD